MPNVKNEEIKQEVERLTQLIAHHDRKYYIENDPEITDQEYDRLYRSLVELEKNHPHLVTADSWIFARCRSCADCRFARFGR